MKLKINLVGRLRDFVVTVEPNMIPVYLMNFINNMELYMKQLPHIHLKWMVHEKERIELLLN